MINSEVYLSEEEFCERYKMKPRTAQRWRSTGDGPAFVRVGPRRVAYRLSDCEAWAASRTYRSRAAELSEAKAA
jgi:predicted DNA-binding transcriptional regulator AlpA